MLLDGTVRRLSMCGLAPTALKSAGWVTARTLCERYSRSESHPARYGAAISTRSVIPVHGAIEQAGRLVLIAV